MFSTPTTLPLTIGSALVAFGPYLSMFVWIVYKKAQLVIVATTAAFFFLLASTAASLTWLVLYEVGGFVGPFAAIVPGVFFQFVSRCAFVSLYHKVERVITISLHKQHQTEMKLAQERRQQQALNNDNNTNNTIAPPQAGRQAYARNVGDTGSALPGSDHAMNPLGGYGTDGELQTWTDIAKLRLELNDAVSAVAASVGYGGMHAILLFGSLLAHETKSNVGVLYQDSCPNIPALAVSACYTLCFSILDVFWMLFTFFGMRRRLMFHRGDYPTVGHTYRGVGAYLGNTRNGGNIALLLTLVTHLVASTFTVSNAFTHGCTFSIPAVAGMVIVTMYLFYAGCGRIYMPPSQLAAPTSGGGAVGDALASSDGIMYNGETVSPRRRRRSSDGVGQSSVASSQQQQQPVSTAALVRENVPSATTSVVSVPVTTSSYHEI